MTSALLFVYIFAAFGLSYILGHSVATRRIRELLWFDQWLGTRFLATRRGFVTLLECPACLGAWVGLAAALLGLVPFETRWNVLIWALFTAGSNYTLARLTGLMPPLAKEK